ncbi:RNase P modulator RnpM [Anaerolentibacter hominis]|uniref:RNase P modulator RnpM n=1 Tax=Anaerolentibacter hominis TaxID=3079009 RepID=UPI0031B7FA13
MGVKKVPQRQCLGCREMKSKRDLIRVIRTPEQEIMIDATGKKNGRGAYLCNDYQCFEKARKSKALERSLKTEIPDEVYDALEKELKAIEQK